MVLVTRFSKIPGINILVITRRETLSVSGQQPEALRLSNWLRTSRSQVKYFKNILELLCISLLQRQDFKVGDSTLLSENDSFRSYHIKQQQRIIYGTHFLTDFPLLIRVGIYSYQSI